MLKLISDPKLKLRRIISLITALVMLFMLCSCGETGNYASTENRKSSVASPGASSGGKESSIFGRKVSYSSYSPAEDLTVPFSQEEILGMEQIEKNLYFLGDGAVFRLDTETGESEKLFDSSASSMTSHGGKIYTYSEDTAALSEYDPKDGSVNEMSYKIGEVDYVDGLSVTDDYFVFKCRTVGKTFIETVLLIYSRETGEQITSQKAPGSGIELFPYKGNKLLSVTVNTVFSGKHLNALDVETGKSENLRELYMEHGDAVAYCPKTDTVLVYGIPGDVTVPGENTVHDAPCAVTEYSLSDSDSIILNRYYIDVSHKTKFFLSTYENAVFAVSDSDNKCRAYDFLDPPESITVLGNNTVGGEIICGFEKSSGILVRVANTDNDTLVLKLMAGDDDFDLYNTGTGFRNFVNAGTVVDLKTVESLRTRISGNAAVEMCVTCSGKYFGVPTEILNLCDEEFYPGDGSAMAYSLATSENIYYAKNIDVEEKRYSDPDGKELYKLLKYINDNPNGNRDKMPFGDGATILFSGVYLMNPKSQNRDGAIKFLEYVFDAYSGAAEGLNGEEPYPQLESTENCYAEWRCRPIEILRPIFDARNKVKESGGMSAKELKELARETAAEVAMRMGE